MFNLSHKQKTEAQVELIIYIFTNILLDYIQYYIQYLHVVARLFVYYMLCPQLHFP